jgi:hypothetical protein
MKTKRKTEKRNRKFQSTTLSLISSTEPKETEKRREKTPEEYDFMI